MQQFSCRKTHKFYGKSNNTGFGTDLGKRHDLTFTSDTSQLTDGEVDVEQHDKVEDDEMGVLEVEVHVFIVEVNDVVDSRVVGVACRVWVAVLQVGP